MVASSLSNAGKLLLLIPTLLLLMSSTSQALEFRVGGSRGWLKPPGNETDPYNIWATKTRFHIGDSLYFKYEKDSVLVVDREDYEDCNPQKPVQKFTDGNTTFQFDRYGYFYFISGEPGHCKAGQMLVVRVMVHPELSGPRISPALPPEGTPGPSGQSESNASPKLIIAGSSVIVAVSGMMLACLF